MNNQINSRRFSITGVVLGLVCVSIIFQMIFIQTGPSADAFRKQKELYSYENLKITPERGLIMDRWGHLLAGNQEVYEIGVDLNLVKYPATIASTMASIVGSNYEDVYSLASQKYEKGRPQYRTLADFVPPAKIDQLDKEKTRLANEAANSRNKNAPTLVGLAWKRHLMRSYPEKTVGSNIIGINKFRDVSDSQGYYGVEEKYNDRLAGTVQTFSISLDPNQAQGLPVVPAGDSLILTIDEAIQASMEEVIDKAIKSTGSASGTLVVMDPKTGELLAVATTPRMDPNEYWKYEDTFPKGVPFDRAISTPYEPGSVFKVLTMAAALDYGAVKPDTVFVDKGVIEVGGGYIYNWNGGAWGPQTMLGCMQHSLNVCLAWVATQLKSTNFYNYIKAFGIGHMTGVDLAGETYWPLRLPGDKNWYPVDLATNAFGQGIAATPMQMVMAISAVANNEGKMMTPHILRAVITNQRQYPTLPQVAGTPIKPETAKTLTDMLSKSLEQESSVALVPGYKVAGKTGTAEIPTATGYSDSFWNASFVGWGPVDDPRFLVYIWLEKPATSKWGSVVAAPVFSEAVKKLVVLMDIPPDDVRHQLAAQAAQPSQP